MRQTVKCKNCGIKWERVTAQYDGETIELTENLMYNCPKCGSNYYGPTDRMASRVDIDWDSYSSVSAKRGSS